MLTLHAENMNLALGYSEYEGIPLEVAHSPS